MQPSARPVRVRALAAAALLVPLALGGCGGDDDATDPVTTAVEPAGEEPADGQATAGDGSGDAGDTDGGAGDANDETGGAAADRDEWIAVGAEYLDGGDREFDECLAAAVVDGFGHEELVATGATPQEFWSAPDLEPYGLEMSDLDDVADDLTGCGDLVEYFAVASGGTEAQAACLREFFDNGDVAEVILTVMTGAEPSQELLDKQADLQACAQDSGAE